MFSSACHNDESERTPLLQSRHPRDKRTIRTLQHCLSVSQAAATEESMRRDSGYSDDDIVMTSGDDTEKLMTSDLTSSDDEARTLKRPGGCSLHWGWVVVASGFYCVAIVGGVGYITGILMDSLKEELAGDTAVISLAGSVQIAVYRFVGPTASKLTASHGGHVVCMSGAAVATLGLLAASFVNTIPLLILFYAVITGLGFGLMYIPAIVACVPYFTKNRSLAIGICLCGSGFGTFALAPLTHVILEKYGWRVVMRTFSGLCGLGVLAGATMSPVTTGIGGKRPSEDSLNNNRAQAAPLRKPNRVLRMFLGHELAASKRLNHYLLFVFTDFLCFTSVYIPYTHLPNFAESQGVKTANAAFLISVGGICNTVGRIVGGAVCDWSLRPRPLALIILTTAASVLPAIALPFCIEYWTFIVNFGLVGFFAGVVVGCANPVLVEMLGLDCLSSAFSGLSALRGLAALLGPPLAGVVVDQTQTLSLPMVISAAVMGAATIMAGVTGAVDSGHRRRTGYVNMA